MNLEFLEIVSVALLPRSDEFYGILEFPLIKTQLIKAICHFF